MADNVIDIDLVELEAAIKRLDLANTMFDDSSKDFLNSISGKLDTMQSDFVRTIKKTMNNMHDTIAPGLLGRVKAYTTELDAIATSFREADKDAASEIQGTS